MKALQHLPDSVDVEWVAGDDVSSSDALDSSPADTPPGAKSLLGDPCGRQVSVSVVAPHRGWWRCRGGCQGGILVQTRTRHVAFGSFSVYGGVRIVQAACLTIVCSASASDATDVVVQIHNNPLIVSCTVETSFLGRTVCENRRWSVVHGHVFTQGVVLVAMVIDQVIGDCFVDVFLRKVRSHGLGIFQVAAQLIDVHGGSAAASRV